MRRWLALLGCIIALPMIVGCSKKEKLSKLEDELSGEAASVVALYKAAYAGAGTGNFSLQSVSEPGNKKTTYISLPDTRGLGTFNSATGEYQFTDLMGMTISVKFTKSADVVYMRIDKIFSGQDVILYNSKDENGTTSTLTAYLSNTNPPTVYLPSVWFYLSTGKPLDWFTIIGVNSLNGLVNFMTNTFPDTITARVSGKVSDGTLNFTMTGTMPEGKPTDSNPISMTGGGTITFDTGQVWTVSNNVSAGDNGPIGGTQTFTSSDGRSGVMTFSADGSMSGTINKDGITVATVAIKADGTGVYTDVAQGKTYAITDAKLKTAKIF